VVPEHGRLGRRRRRRRADGRVPAETRGPPWRVQAPSLHLHVPAGRGVKTWGCLEPFGCRLRASSGERGLPSYVSYVCPPRARVEAHRPAWRACAHLCVDVREAALCARGRGDHHATRVDGRREETCQRQRTAVGRLRPIRSRAAARSGTLMPAGRAHTHWLRVGWRVSNCWSKYVNVYLVALTQANFHTSSTHAPAIDIYE
jgi:hypothetical protein